MADTFSGIARSSYRRSEVKATSVEWTKNVGRPPQLYAEARKGLAERVAIFQEMMEGGAPGETFNGIFSGSLVPTDPERLQPIYYKHGFKRAPDWLSPESMSSSFEQIENTGIETNSPIKTPGFLKPSPLFASPAVSESLDPEHLSEAIIKTDLHSAAEIAAVADTIISEQLREKVTRIVSLFLQDAESRQLLLVVIDPSAEEGAAIKELFFNKV
jgi:hypothetical protein